MNIVAHGFDGAESSTKGITHYLETASATNRAQINSLQLVDPSEMSGMVGKTPLGVTNLGDLAQRSGQIGAQGVPVAVYTVEGKLGTQHIGNVAAFRDTPGVDVYATPWKASLQTNVSIGLPSAERPLSLGVGLGVSNAGDQASSRTDLGARDWFSFRNGAQQHVTGTLSDLGQGYLGLPSPRPSEVSVTSPIERGGIVVGPVHLARGEGGRIVFKSGSDMGGELALVYPIFDGNIRKR